MALSPSASCQSPGKLGGSLVPARSKMRLRFEEVLVATSMDKRPRVFTMSFGSVYPLYVQKAAKKGRTREEVDQVIAWLTGYTGEQLQRAIDAKFDIEAFFAQAPRTRPRPVHR